MDPQQAIDNPFAAPAPQAAPQQPQAQAIDDPFAAAPQQAQSTQQDPYGQKQLPNGTVSASPGGVVGWLHDLETDLRHGTNRTMVGKLLNATGAPGNAGSADAPGSSLLSPVFGAIHGAEGVANIPSHPVQGTKQAASGALEMLSHPALALPSGEAAVAAGAKAPGLISKAADAVSSVTPQGVKDVVQGVKQVTRPVTDAAGSAIDTFKNMAQKFYAPQALKAVRDAGEHPDTVATAERSMEDINNAALPQMKATIGKVIDDANAAIGHDTTQAPSLTAKLASGGMEFKRQAQTFYKQADDIAAQATGQKGAFQRLGQAVEDAKIALQNPALTNDESVAATERLANAQKAYDEYHAVAKARGVNVDELTGKADKLYSTGLSMEQFGQKALASENAAGQLKASRAPLNNAVKQLAVKVGNNRGHVLAQAVGNDGAAKVLGAVNDAESTIAAARSAKAAATQTVRAGARADKQIGKIRKRQIIGGSALTGISGTAGYVAHSLHGKD
jgi:hypothetical protein